MTCCVGYTDGRTVTLGADSMQSCSDGTYGLSRLPKAWRSGPVVMATCGDIKPPHIIRTGLVVQNRKARQDVEEYLVRDVIPRMQDTLKAGGFDTAEYDSMMLIGAYGRLFVLYADWSLAEYTRPYAAIGSGDMLALGAMAAISSDVPPQDRIKRALKAAEAHSQTVRGPFRIVSTGDAGGRKS